MEKPKRNRKLLDDAQLPTLKEVQFSESIKTKIYSHTSNNTNKPNYVDKFKPTKGPPKTNENNFVKKETMLKMRNNSQISMASLSKNKKFKKGILKKPPPKKVKFTKTIEEIETKVDSIQTQENVINEAVVFLASKNETYFSDVDNNINKYKNADDDEDYFIISVESESDDNDESIDGLIEHAPRIPAASPRYTLLLNELNYYRRKVQLLQNENINMHAKISVLEDKLKGKNAEYNEGIISEDSLKEKLPSIIETDKKKESNKIKPAENFIENYNNFMTKLTQRKIINTDSFIQGSSNGFNEHLSVSEMDTLKQNSAQISRKSTLFNAQNFEASRIDSPSNRHDVKNGRSTFKLPGISSNKSSAKL